MELPRYKLILRLGNITDLMLIVHTIMELTHLCRAEATHKMWEAYHSGRSQVLVAFRERAELYAEQFASRGLSVVLEPA
jgi:ATP-dependent Clp protease adapter protein ClpS